MTTYLVLKSNHCSRIGGCGFCGPQADVAVKQPTCIGAYFSKILLLDFILPAGCVDAPAMQGIYFFLLAQLDHEISLATSVGTQKLHNMAGVFDVITGIKHS